MLEFIFRVLLEHSADVNARMAGASTALHIVANMSGASWLSGDSEKDIVAADDKRLEFARCAKELVRWGANILLHAPARSPPLHPPLLLFPVHLATAAATLTMSA